MSCGAPAHQHEITPALAPTTAAPTTAPDWARVSLPLIPTLATCLLRAAPRTAPRTPISTTAIQRSTPMTNCPLTPRNWRNQAPKTPGRLAAAAPGDLTSSTTLSTCESATGIVGPIITDVVAIDSPATFSQCQHAAELSSLSTT